MVEIIKKDQRHFSDFNWLQTYWLFSFSSYYDPHNIQFGALRVFNDDIVAPGAGLPTHPHEEMEIITIVLEGEMTHEDSMGNKTLIKTGEVQRMSAGKGSILSLISMTGPFIFTRYGYFLASKDQARVDMEEAITFSANADSEFVRIDVPSCKGWGYDKETLQGERV